MQRRARCSFRRFKTSTCVESKFLENKCIYSHRYAISKIRFAIGTASPLYILFLLLHIRKDRTHHYTLHDIASVSKKRLCMGYQYQGVYAVHGAINLRKLRNHKRSITNRASGRECIGEKLGAVEGSRCMEQKLIDGRLGRKV